MVSNLALNAIKTTSIGYPVLYPGLPFDQYILACQNMIRARRTDLHKYPHVEPSTIVAANSPFELLPDHPNWADKSPRTGVLLIHGLFDCPFSVRDIANQLHAQGMMCRSVLLPGQGTVPSDLLHVTYHDWINAVRYAVNGFKQEVDRLFLVGYSTGAALSIYEAIQDSEVTGIVLLSPAIKIKMPIDLIMGWRRFVKWLRNKHKWAYIEDEIDYAKYHSIAFNPVEQVHKLTHVVAELNQQHRITTPLMMVTSEDDETISSDAVVEFFAGTQNTKNKLIYYTANHNRFDDDRIIYRQSHFEKLHINNFSHVCIPFAPTNYYYGENGTYQNAAHPNTKEYVYGGYNRLESKATGFLQETGLLKRTRRELTYNPDFDFMAQEIVKFVQKV